MTEASGRSLELFYIDGRPDGMITAELFNWTGHVLVAPRIRLAEALSRRETACSGVYLLLGEKEGENAAYIGEAEELSSRLRTHARSEDKEWWETAVMVSATGNRLNKAHVRYLEARLIGMAREVGHTLLQNGTSPPLPSLTEADIAKMEAFLANLMVVLPAVRVDMFIQRSRPAGSTRSIPAPAAGNSPAEPAVAASDGIHFLARKTRRALLARAVLHDGEFIVEAGSEASDRWLNEDGKGGNYKLLYEELRRSGVLVPQGPLCVFTRDYAFHSPSAAASVVFGHSTNGPSAWKLEEDEDVTYADWQAAQLSGAGGHG
ncbi:GIY-YIG nuclease family protein [Acetobacter conturbans]|uniref:DUF4357 domain-containing protein n=1 Tax=Acetobacter conturbans TaxID=1737472 RepID=A0ABX0K3G6_9PROT|nr:GIY-YIG nuclease family protein [Acetobacter conturbans]NHN89346.1 DUF4357 domain-containing protein [Acetobacter conturbans]